MGQSGSFLSNEIDTRDNHGTNQCKWEKMIIGPKVKAKPKSIQYCVWGNLIVIKASSESKPIIAVMKDTPSQRVLRSLRY